MTVPISCSPFHPVTVQNCGRFNTGIAAIKALKVWPRSIPEKLNVITPFCTSADFYQRKLQKNLVPHCTANAPTLSSNCGSGNVEEIGGLKTYVTGDEDSKLAVLLLADAYGYEVPKLRKLADKIAASLGFFVVVPDFYYGDPIEPDTSREAWIASHSPDKGCEDAKNVIAALKNKGVIKIGAAGFCWGGMVVVRLAKYDCIQAAVVLHPGPLTVEEINEVKTPIAILGAETDNFAPPELLKHLGDILSAKGEVDCFVKIFPGVGHGWTVRYNDDDEFAVKSAEESHSDMINWLTKYIK